MGTDSEQMYLDAEYLVHAINFAQILAHKTWTHDKRKRVISEYPIKEASSFDMF